jgi:hypothetical protein
MKKWITSCCGSATTQYEGNLFKNDSRDSNWALLLLWVGPVRLKESKEDAETSNGRWVGRRNGRREILVPSFPVWGELAATCRYSAIWESQEAGISLLVLAPSAFSGRWFQMEDSLCHVAYENITQNLIRQNLMNALSNKTTWRNGENL